MIAKGLQAGEPVVTEGGDRLKDGAGVQLAADLASAPGARRVTTPTAHPAPRGASRPHARRAQRVGAVAMKPLPQP